MIMSDGIEKWRQIGDRLRKAREYLELKQEEAAEAVGLSRSALSLVENGRRKVDAVELARFAEVYRQSIEALTGAAETPPLPESVQALARAATELSVEDRDELLRFAEFLQTRSPRGASRG
jgi:transcriptional regulator with XRE-family HTH domain